MKHSNTDTKITVYDYVLIYEYIGSLLKCQNLFNENSRYFILLLINDCYEAADYSNYFRRRQFRKIAALLSGWLGSAYRRNSRYRFEHGAAAFFDLQTGLKLALWDRKNIAHETNVTLTAPSPAEFT
ncbi:Uncharacterised protein [Mycobacteroides abscessus subsp. massiliense]|nr:Lactoylglutathione lyase [Bacillus velezensis]SLC39807.1 Uncharacterised protein [Mycobacteroides abscessus subsp. massiliense]